MAVIPSFSQIKKLVFISQTTWHLSQKQNNLKTNTSLYYHSFILKWKPQISKNGDFKYFRLSWHFSFLSKSNLKTTGNLVFADL